MTEQVPERDLASELDFTQSIRKKVVTAFCANGEVPTDKDGVNALAKMLDGMDKQTTTIQKLKGDERSRDIVETAMELQKTMFNSRGGSCPFMQDVGVAPINQIDPSVPLIDGVTILPGEFDTAISSETYEDFSRKMNI